MDYRPIIGIVLSPPERDCPAFNLNPEYADSVLRAGGDPIAFPLVPEMRYVKKIVDLVDGVLLTGSTSNIDPHRYGQSPNAQVNPTDHRRDAFDLLIINQARELHMPIMGICHGCQALNVAYGGSLIQEIDSQVDQALMHRTKSATGEYAHDVVFQEGSVLNQQAGEITVAVNSAHTQSIGQLGTDLRPIGAAADGVIEAMESIDVQRHFVLGVQWHPERLAAADPFSASTFELLVTAARSWHYSKQSTRGPA